MKVYALSYTRLFYHVIFRTKCSLPVIPEKSEKDLFAYIWGFIRNKNSQLYRINGMPDHLHLLIDIPPVFAIADFLRDLKTQTHKWMETSGNFPDFTGWAEGYAALSYCIRDREMISDYIKNQKEHHRTEDFATELRRILRENGISFDEKWFLKD